MTHPTACAKLALVGKLLSISVNTLPTVPITHFETVLLYAICSHKSVQKRTGSRLRTLR